MLAKSPMPNNSLSAGVGQSRLTWLSASSPPAHRKSEYEASGSSEAASFESFQLTISVCPACSEAPAGGLVKRTSQRMKGAIVERRNRAPASAPLELICIVMYPRSNLNHSRRVRLVLVEVWLGSEGERGIDENIEARVV